MLTAIEKAFVTSDDTCWVSIDQPTTRRECASKTTQQSTFPSRVGCSVSLKGFKIQVHGREGLVFQANRSFEILHRQRA